jgi:hypothetical protein
MNKILSLLKWRLLPLPVESRQPRVINNTAIKLALEEYKVRGDVEIVPVDKDDLEHRRTSVDPDLWYEAEQAAIKHGATVSEFVRALLTRRAAQE